MYTPAPLFAILAFALAALSPSAAAQQRFRIAGVVVDSISGTPIDRAEVTIAPVSDLNNGATTWSASNGQFVFTGLASGKYRLTASLVGYTQQGLDQHEGFMTAIAVGPKLDSEHIRFRLFRESVIAGNVSDESGEPVRGAQLFLFRRGFSGGAHTTQPAGHTETDDLGDYRFPHLASGTYFVVAYARPWYGNSSQLVDRLRASDVSISSRQVRGFNFRDSGGLVSNDAAEFQPEPPPAANRLRDVVYPLSYYSNADSLDSATPLALSSGATVTTDFSLHPIPGLHLQIKAPIPSRDTTHRSATPGAIEYMEAAPLGASLQLAGVDLESLAVQHSPQMPGYFEVSNAPPGEITFRFIERSEEGFSIQTTLEQVASESRIDLSSAASVSVAGTVDPIPPRTVTDAGQGVSRLGIALTSADGRTTHASQIGAKGEFSLDIPAGNYTVNLIPPGFAHVSSLQAAGAQVTAHSISLVPGSAVNLSIHLVQADATVSGVALKNGHPCAGAMIVLVPEDSTQSAALFHRDQSDSDGTFLMSPIFPGRYTLLAIENGWDLEWSKLSVLFPYLAAGVPLEVKPGANVSISVKVQ